MPTINNKNNTQRLAAVQKLKDGFVKHLAASGNVAFGTKTWTPAEVEADIQSLVDAHNAAEAARGAFHDAVGVARKARTDVAKLVALIKQLALIRSPIRPRSLRTSASNRRSRARARSRTSSRPWRRA
jgi:hypothetical protein